MSLVIQRFVRNVARTVGVGKHSQQFSSARVLQNSRIAVSVGDKNVAGRHGHGHGSGLTKSPVPLAVLEPPPKRQRRSERSRGKLYIHTHTYVYFISFSSTVVN